MTGDLRNKPEEYVSELTDQDKDLSFNIKDFLHLWERVVITKKVVDFSLDFNHDEYLNIDNNLQSGGLLSHQDIINQVPSEITVDQLDDEEEKKVDMIIAETAKKEDENKAFETLRLFLLQNKQDCGNLIQKMDGF